MLDAGWCYYPTYTLSPFPLLSPNQLHLLPSFRIHSVRDPPPFQEETNFLQSQSIHFLPSAHVHLFVLFSDTLCLIPEHEPSPDLASSAPLPA